MEIIVGGVFIGIVCAVIYLAHDIRRFREEVRVKIEEELQKRDK